MKSINLLTYYEQAVAEQDIVDDPQQRQALNLLTQIADELLKPTPWFSWRKPTVQGLYLYGPVGVGKTFLMDLFFTHLPLETKIRLHFHQFMQQVDKKLRLLQGISNPIQRIAEDIAATTRLLCFDEMMVDDVAYAMILSDLFQALFARKIVLIATSNAHPDELYRNGVQRDRFLPAIAAIKTHCTVFKMEPPIDYRLGRQPANNNYLVGSFAETDAALLAQFLSLESQTPTGLDHNQLVSHREELIIQHRSIPYIRLSEQSVWFDFAVICNVPRSQLDYLELAARFNTILVGHVTPLTEKDTFKAILLIHFVDVMYDQGVRLVIGATVTIDKLYEAGEMSDAFKRTTSRLHEMQSADYQRRHLHHQVSNFK